MDLNKPILAREHEIQFFTELSFRIVDGAFQASRSLVGDNCAWLSILPFQEPCPLTGDPENKVFYHLSLPPLNSPAPLFRAGVIECESVAMIEEPTPLKDLSLALINENLRGEITLRSVTGEPVRFFPFSNGLTACIDVWRHGPGKLEVNYVCSNPVGDPRIVTCSFDSSDNGLSYAVPSSLTSHDIAISEKMNTKLASLFGQVNQLCTKGEFRNKIC